MQEAFKEIIEELNKNYDIKNWNKPYAITLSKATEIVEKIAQKWTRGATMENVKATMELTTEKIKATNVMIIVESVNDGKPYYCIRYYDVVKKQTCIGYGSYNLDYVVQWKEECFEIVDSNKAIGQLVRNKREAIEVLESNKPTSGYYMLQEAIDMAIEALEESIVREDDGK